MESVTRVLHLEDDPVDRELVRAELEGADLQVAITAARSRTEFEAALHHAEVDLILADYRLPAYDGVSALRLARVRCPDAPFLFVSGTMGEDAAIECLTEGATDYVLKERLSRLVPAVRRALREAENRRERREAERALRTLSRAVEQSPASIVVTDIHGNIQYVNPKFTQVTGYVASEVVGRNPRLLKSGEMSPAQYEELWRTIAGGREWRGEFHNRKKNGELYWELASISPILDDHGRTTHYLAVKEDITDYKRLQGELRQAQKMEVFGQLAGGIAHDFNNLLTVIQGGASFLQETELTGEQAAEVEAIAGAAARAADLTRQLLTFSRRQTPRRVHVDVNELVANLTKLLRRVIGEHISLTTHDSAERPLVSADPGMLEQVLVNLAVNARDAMPTGGRLSIRTEVLPQSELRAATHARGHAGPVVRVSVTDSGCGIPPEVLPRVFEPFFTTKGMRHGTGLGLAIVFGIMEQHHGWIETETEVGVGTTFRLHLPWATADAAASAVSTGQVAELSGNELVLLVEDENRVRTAARRALEQRGYRVLEAGSAAEAVRVWTDHRDLVDVLVTDVVMPGGMNGLALADRLRMDRPSLKVIFCSGHSDEVLADGTLRASADFLGKPYLPTDLLRKIRECLDLDASGEAEARSAEADTTLRPKPGDERE